MHALALLPLPTALAPLIELLQLTHPILAGPLGPWGRATHTIIPNTEPCYKTTPAPSLTLLSVCTSHKPPASTRIAQPLVCRCLPWPTPFHLPYPAPCFISSPRHPLPPRLRPRGAHRPLPRRRPPRRPRGALRGAVRCAAAVAVERPGALPGGTEGGGRGSRGCEDLCLLLCLTAHLHSLSCRMAHCARRSRPARLQLHAPAARQRTALIHLLRNTEDSIEYDSPVTLPPQVPGRSVEALLMRHARASQPTPDAPLMYSAR